MHALGRRLQTSVQSELKASGDGVLELNLGIEDVGSRPRFSDCESVALIAVLCLKVSGNRALRRVLRSGYGELLFCRPALVFHSLILSG